MDHRVNSTSSASAFGAFIALRPTSLTSLITTTIVILVVYYVVDIVRFAIRFRSRYHDIPSPARHWFWGTLIAAGDKLNPSNVRHPDYGIEEWWNEMGQPPLFLIDVAPVDVPIMVIADPALAEQLVQPTPLNKYSTPKSDSLEALRLLTGSQSMLQAEGETWKGLRKRFNKGFSPAHLHSLAPLVVSKTRIFVDRLKAAAKENTTFEMKGYSQDLTTDIITTIAIQKDFEAQSCPEGQGPKGPLGFLTASRKLSGLLYKVGQGFHPLHYLDPIRPTKAWFYARIQTRILDDLIREKLKADQQQQPEHKVSTSSSSGKAIVQLALQGLPPTNSLITNTRDQIKTFLFAGQDTTATAIQWISYELSRASGSPFLAALRAEHDAVFGAHSPFSALDVLAHPENAETILGVKIPRTTAFVKEILRVHPPAATARVSPFDPKTEAPLTLDVAGKPVLVDGLRSYVCQWIIHRSEKVWGADAREFKPERWLDDEYVRGLPVGAWRPFERGPRNCIGQELAMMELKVVVCVLARGVVFEKVGFNGRDGEVEVFDVHEVTHVPNDGMRMRVKMREE